MKAMKKGKRLANMDSKKEDEHRQDVINHYFDDFDNRTKSTLSNQLKELEFSMKNDEDSGDELDIVHVSDLGYMVIDPFEVASDERHTPDGLVIRIDSNDNYITTGLSNGVILSHQMLKNKLTLVSKIKSSCSAITSLRFKPYLISRGVVLVGNADGTLSQWHIPSGKLMNKLKLTNSILSLDYNLEGNLSALGSNEQVSIIDDNVKVEIVCFGGKSRIKGHKGRVNSVVFNKQTANLLASGDDDGKIFLYDVRQGKLQIKNYRKEYRLVQLRMCDNG